MFHRFIPACIFFLTCHFSLVVAAGYFDLGSRYFENVGDPKSIPLGIVTSIAEDQSGFIWLGTQKGLLRYDGYRFRHFSFNVNDPNSLSGDFINTLFLSADGRLWVGTRTDGISIYDPVKESFQRYSHQSDNPDSLVNNDIRAFAEDKQGGKWIATNEGLEYLAPGSEKFLHFRQEPGDSDSLNDNRIYSLLIDDQDSLWVGSRNGLNRLSGSGTGFESIHSDPKVDNSLAGQKIISLFQAKDKKIWIGTNENGVAWISKDNQFGRIGVAPENPTSLSHPQIRSIIQVNDHEVWFGTYGGGINVVDATTARVKEIISHNVAVQSTINLDNIGSLWIDRAGLVWIGTWGGGLNRFNPTNGAFRTLRYMQGESSALNHEDVLSVLELNNGDLWIGTRGNGIDIIKYDNGGFEAIRPNPDDANSLADGTISELMETSDGVVWIGTRQAGLYCYFPETKKLCHYTEAEGLSGNSIRRLMPDHQGRIWVGTSGGLNRFDPNTEIFESFRVKNSQQGVVLEQFDALAIQADGTLWAGSLNGLYTLASNETELVRIGSKQNQKGSLSHNNINGLMIDSHQQLWVASQQGLDKLKSWDGNDAVFESVSKQVGLPGQALWANLLEDEQGRIWDGNSVIDTKSWHRYKLEAGDGVDIGVNWYSAYARSATGLFLYGGTKGLLMVKPERFKHWNYNPPLVVSTLKIDGIAQPVVNNFPLILDPAIKGFSVEFSALDFSSPDKNKYAYQLQGYDREWIETDSEHRIASYTNLDAGNYTLRIKGSNRLGVWSNRVLALPISVHPAWYQTLWFKSVGFILLLGLMYFVYFQRVRQLQHRRHELSQQVKKRTEELEKSTQNISTLSQIGAEISSTLELDKILNTVYLHVNELMDANVFWIGLYKPDEHQINFKIAIERGESLDEFSISMNESTRLAVWCIKHEAPIVINDYVKDRKIYLGDVPYITPKAGEDTESIMYWPLQVVGRTIGVISVQSFRKNAYNQGHQDMLKTIASYTAIALDNANAYREVKKHRDNAEQATRIKSEFLANMSHEIRTPMHGILGMSNLIKKTSLDEEQKDYIETIDASAKTLLKVINDILDFSKVEAGELKFEEKPFSLSRVLENLSAVVKVLIAEKDIKFSYKIEPDTPADLVFDPTRFYQVMLNLCSNAVKFTPQGKIEVYVKSNKRTKDFCELQIDVIDQGIGMGKETVSNLFKSFSQADASISRKFGGTGLGLAISKRLASMMNGDIHVTSEFGKGSCFSFISEVKLNPLTEFLHNKNLKLNHPCSVVIFDNESIRMQHMVERLNLLNVNSELRTDINELLNCLKLENKVFNTLIIDWEMMIENGEDEAVEILKMIKGISDDKTIKMIVCSENQHLVSIPHGLFANIKILQKPVSCYQLYHALNDREFKKIPVQEDKKNILKDVRILLAEDNIVNQLIAKKILVRYGAFLDLAENGKTAVELVLKNSYDIVLMDIQMPEMDGIEATKIIRANSKYEKLPIIAMTANVLKEDIEKYQKNGMNEHISKPFKNEELISKILGLLKLDPTAERGK